jgi:hypothetical protein
MSFLYPLLLAGMAAVGLPILLHIVRRRTRRHVTFSSLMFLRPTAPRLRHRSRIEHLLLLLVRCLVLCLLAVAFARPFFVSPPVEAGPAAGRRFVLLLDTSASMRRTGLWNQALREVRSTLVTTNPSDRVCLMCFDNTTRTLVGFDQWQATQPARRTEAVVARLSDLSPTWASTDVGQALVAAAEAIEDDEVNDQEAVGTRQVVLISDLQQGSDLEALTAYEWPENTELSVRPLRAEGLTDAAIQLVTGRDHLARLDDEASPRVRVTNSAQATAQRFSLRWADAPDQRLDVYVPAGGSTVVKAPVRAPGLSATRLVLTGDDHDFDNTLYVTPALEQPIRILYVGSDDPNDPQDLLFYLRRAFGAAEALNVQLIQHLAGSETEQAQLAIVTEAVDASQSEPLRHFMESGHTALCVLKSDDTMGGILKAFGLGDGLSVGQAESLSEAHSTTSSDHQYAMLGRMEFTHPLLSPFSDPKFGDFTRIHIWNHRHIDTADLPNTHVLAWFDTNDPAILETPIGRGSLLTLTFGWRPADSDLALSSKFVPLLYSVLEYAGVRTGEQPQYFVGDSVPIPALHESESTQLQIRKPDGSLVTLDAGAAAFTATDLPGIYTIESPTESQSFAVNLPASECRTDPMEIDDLEKLGVSFSDSAQVSIAQRSQTKRTEDLVTMENRQKLWRWVIVALLAVLLFETWLAGWTMTRPVASAVDAESASQGERT